MALSAGVFSGKEGAEEGVTLEAVKVEGNGMGNGGNDRLEPALFGGVGAHSVLLGGSRFPRFLRPPEFTARGLDPRDRWRNFHKNWAANGAAGRGCDAERPEFRGRVWNKRGSRRYAAEAGYAAALGKQLVVDLTDATSQK